MEMAAQAPGRIRALVLASTGHNAASAAELPRREARIAQGHADMGALVDDWLAPMVAPDRRGDRALMDDLRAMAVQFDAATHERQIRALMARPDAAAGLAGLRCPVLLVVGEDDGWSPPAQHHEIAARVAGAEMRVIPGAGHFLPAERPGETVAAITGWLAGKGLIGAAPALSADPTETGRRKIPHTPLFDRDHNRRGYALNKFAMSLGTPAGREAFRADEDAWLARFGLDAETIAAVKARDYAEMVRLSGNLFFILKISALDPTPITAIGAAQAGMEHERFLKERLGR